MNDDQLVWTYAGKRIHLRVGYSIETNNLQDLFGRGNFYFYFNGEYPWVITSIQE